MHDVRNRKMKRRTLIKRLTSRTSREIHHFDVFRLSRRIALLSLPLCRSKASPVSASPSCGRMQPGIINEGEKIFFPGNIRLTIPVAEARRACPHKREGWKRVFIGGDFWRRNSRRTARTSVLIMKLARRHLTITNETSRRSPDRKERFQAYIFQSPSLPRDIKST